MKQNIVKVNRIFEIKCVIIVVSEIVVIEFIKNVI